MSRTALSCRELVDFIGSFLEGKLPEQDLRRFEQHLAVCPGCAIYLDGYRKAGELQALAFDPEAACPETAPEDLIAALLDLLRQAHLGHAGAAGSAPRQPPTPSRGHRPSST